MVKNLPANAGYTGSIPGLGRFPGETCDNLLQYSCLENPTDRGAWRTTVHWVAVSDPTEAAKQECTFKQTRKIIVVVVIIV